jgi:hypothetical protein
LASKRKKKERKKRKEKKKKIIREERKKKTQVTQHDCRFSFNIYKSSWKSRSIPVLNTKRSILNSG